MADDPDWLTWPQAAELVGCPISTIEHHARTGRITRRPGQGRRSGSLNRESVEEFAAWWREHTAGLQERRQHREDRRIRPPEPQGWIPATGAAERLGYAHSDHVVYLARQGRLEGRKVNGRWWVREAEVEAYREDRDRWISWLDAAQLVGCSHETIRRAVADGRIEKRVVHRAQASLSRASVERFAENRRR
ncbi:hypothetical protein [Nocardioides lianchengensis]|uniref:Uncharacterized protein n=1 Tax=Nocardioides lianchengensis TaxID=1045774 RepID=A0A1G6LVU6_9ACTN|nr:hypothetical protein [Nocardioides lianchengensis]NYG12433.1 hypothetical protein [Nocardioides lianchengensis]SDC47184.1 hypothetical protein SAMN05421872_102371 [Nocardioides lianchengensis]